MAVNLSFIGGAGWQFFDNNGVPLAGGKIYTYAAGTTVPLATYTARDGLTANTNPIILDSAGRTPAQIWSTEGVLYKYVVATNTDVVLRIWDNIGGSVVASDLGQDLANTTDNTKGDALIGFKQSNQLGFLIGATARTVNDKLQEIVSVKDFGAVGDGVTDDLNAFLAAVASFGPTGGAIYVPPGDYLVSDQITFDKPIYMFGAGAKSTTIITNDPTGNVILFDVAYCQVEKMCFDAAVTRTAGAYIAMSINVIRSRVRDFTMLNGFTGIAATCVDSVWIDTGDIFDTVSNGYGIRLLGDGVTAAGNDIYINKVTMSGNANLAAAGIQITNNGAINITDCDIIRHGNGIQIEPGAGEVATSIYIENTYFDTSTNGMWIVPGAGGTVQGVRAVGTWFGNQSGYGVVCAAGSGTCGGIELISPHVSDNATGGILLDGCVDFHMVGGYISATTPGVGNGVTVTANTSAWSFIGSRIGNGYLKNGNNIGIFVAAGTSNFYSIIGCDLNGNNTALVDGGTGVNKRITGNLGLTPLNGSSVTVGPSPFLYTAGGLPETVYIVGGNVSSIITQGVAVFANSDHTVALGPNESVQITYSVAPSIKAVPHYN